MCSSDLPDDGPWWQRRPVESLRQDFKDAIYRRVSDPRTAGVIAALAVGDGANGNGVSGAGAFGGASSDGSDGDVVGGVAMRVIDLVLLDNGSVSVSFAVPVRDAVLVAQLSATGQLVVVRLPAGAALDDASAAGSTGTAP